MNPVASFLCCAPDVAFNTCLASSVVPYRWDCGACAGAGAAAEDCKMARMHVPAMRREEEALESIMKSEVEKC